MKQSVYVLLSGAFLMAGCTTFSPEQCQAINPYEQGLSDGRLGAVMAQGNDMISACQSNGSLRDVGAFKNTYLKAYKKGLAEYCTPANGERVGLLGQEYYGVCPKENEASFLKEYLYARKQYNDAHPQFVPYPHSPHHHIWLDPFDGPFWMGHGHRRHPRFHGFIRGAW